MGGERILWVLFGEGRNGGNGEEGEGGLTTLGTQLWFIYTRSLFRFMCVSRPICTVAYVALSASVQGGKPSLAKKPKGGRAMVEKDLVVKSVSVENWTFCIWGCEGWGQKGVRGAIFCFVVG